MNVSLCMRPGDEPKTWEAFCAEATPYAIALDGYVAAGPRFDDRGPWLNLNHHEEVDRIATRATCGQVLQCVRLGLLECFRDEQGFRANVYVNDCDEDVCASWTVLHNVHLAEHTMNPLLNRFIGLVDQLDTSAGAYPFPETLPILQELEWIFQPYRQFRQSGGLDRRDPAAFTSIVEDVEHRILRHIVGEGEAVPLDTRYQRIGGNTFWAMISEIGSQGRTGAFADGIRAYVIVRERSDGRWAYTIGRVSPFVRFPVSDILARLCEIEGARWGGGNTIGGSPRATGSTLDPQTVERTIRNILAKNER